MKKLLVLVLVLGAAQFAFGDIQDPPSNDYGPTRKLGRGLANMFFAPTEIVNAVLKENDHEGDNAAYSYGAVRGVGRTVERNWVGVFEVLTFPFPIWRHSYAPILPDDIRWKHAGYSEFPPEMIIYGNESKYDYVRQY